MQKRMSTHTNDMLGASLRRKHAENARTTSNIENSLSLEQMRVVHDRVPVGAGSDGVLEHLLVDTWPEARESEIAASRENVKEGTKVCV